LLPQPNLRITCVTEGKVFSLSQDLGLKNDVVNIDSLMALCLLPLFDQSLSMMSLVEYWQKFRPFNPLTGNPVEKIEVFHLLQTLLLVFHDFDLIMLETQY
jgi:hypothetical protein